MSSGTINTNKYWPLLCRHCERKWSLMLPDLPILAQAFVRLMKAFSRCPYCDSRKVCIVLEPSQDRQVSSDPAAQTEQVK